MASQTGTRAKSASAAPTRKTRKSLAPEMLRQTRQKEPETTDVEMVDCRLQQQQQRATNKKTLESALEESDKLNDLDELNLGPNPTPQMIARKRRSLAVTSSSATVTTTPRATKKDAAVAATQPAPSPAAAPETVVKVANKKAARSRGKIQPQI